MDRNDTNLDPQWCNLRDFREEWVALCGSSNRLKGKEISFSSPYPALNTAAAAVFQNHGARVLPENAQWVILLDPQEDLADYPPGTNLVLVLTQQRQHWQGMNCGILLSIPPLYSLALTEEYPPLRTETDGISPADLLDILVDMVAKGTPGRYALGNAEGFTPLSHTPLISSESYRDTCKILQAHPQRRYYHDDSFFGKLRQLQLLQLKCLLELDRVCRENNISYFLGGGTLLGAVRHRGFIPWDDDVDVMMDRKNFERFRQVAPKALGEAFFYQDSVTDPSYHSPFSKIRLLETRFATPFSSNFPDMHNEIYIDIFAHDGAPRQPLLLKAHIFLTRLVRSLVYHKWGNSPLQYGGRLKWVCALADKLIAHVSLARLEKLQNFVLTFYDAQKTGMCYDGMGEHLDHGSFPAAILRQTEYIEFEGRRFPVPKDFPAYLRFSYGSDFMQWPRPGLRCSHHEIAEFSLGIYDPVYIQEKVRKQHGGSGNQYGNNGKTENTVPAL